MNTIPFKSHGLPVGAVIPVALLALWEAVARLGLGNALFLPPPSQIATRFVTLLAAGELWIDIAASLSRVFAGVVIGGTLGVVVGLLLGSFSGLRLLLGPSFNVFKQIAIFAWIPLISAWFGTGESAKVVFVALAVFAPVVVNAWEGARDVPAPLREVTAVYDFSAIERLRLLVLPAALPQIITGLRLGLIYGWLATIGAEYFMTVAPGIGGQMTAGRELLQMDLVFIGVFLLGAFGFGLNALAEKVEARLLRWKARH